MIRIAKPSEPHLVGRVPMARDPQGHHAKIAELGFSKAYAIWVGAELERCTEWAKRQWKREWTCPMHDIGPYRFHLKPDEPYPVWVVTVCCESCLPRG